MPITLTDFTIKESRDGRGYIFFDLRATLSDGRKVLSMSHESRIQALTSLGEELERANDAASALNVRLRTVANHAQGIKSVRMVVAKPEIYNKPIAPPNKPEYNPMAPRLIKSRRND